MRFPCVHAAATTPVQRLGVLLLISPSRISLPRSRCRVGLHIVLFEVCSAFTHVAACTLAPSPYFVTAIRGFRHFVASMPAPVASGWSCSPGGACTHWKAPPFHGARSKRTLLARAPVARGHPARSLQNGDFGRRPSPSRPDGGKDFRRTDQRRPVRGLGGDMPRPHTLARGDRRDAISLLTRGRGSSSSSRPRPRSYDICQPTVLI